ncbi:MAG: helix-turn-helix domain-containing protein [Acidobacteriota bacterium]
MMMARRKFIEKEGWKQADAAKRLGLSQPRIADLKRGKISRFSLDALVSMILDAGMEVNFRNQAAIPTGSLTRGHRAARTLLDQMGRTGLRIPRQKLEVGPFRRDAIASNSASDHELVR